MRTRPAQRRPQRQPGEDPPPTGGCADEDDGDDEDEDESAVLGQQRNADRCGQP